jgi:hypothetical protein
MTVEEVRLHVQTVLSLGGAGQGAAEAPSFVGPFRTRSGRGARDLYECTPLPFRGPYGVA